MYISILPGSVGANGDPAKVSEPRMCMEMGLSARPSVRVEEFQNQTYGKCQALQVPWQVRLHKSNTKRSRRRNSGGFVFRQQSGSNQRVRHVGYRTRASTPTQNSMAARYYKEVADQIGARIHPAHT